jgi:hypothetical protein
MITFSFLQTAWLLATRSPPDFYTKRRDYSGPRLVSAYPDGHGSSPESGA